MKTKTKIFILCILLLVVIIYQSIQFDNVGSNLDKINTKYEPIVYTGLQVWQNGRYHIYTEEEIEALKPVLLDCDSIKIVHKLWITEK